jgi:hypothetical protein
VSECRMCCGMCLMSLLGLIDVVAVVERVEVQPYLNDFNDRVGIAAP